MADVLSLLCRGMSEGPWQLLSAAVLMTLGSTSDTRPVSELRSMAMLLLITMYIQPYVVFLSYLACPTCFRWCNTTENISFWYEMCRGKVYPIVKRVIHQWIFSVDIRPVCFKLLLLLHIIISVGTKHNSNIWPDRSGPSFASEI